MILSQSEIQTYLRCKRKWWLSYYRGLKQTHEKRTGSSALGNSIHAALADYYGSGGAVSASETVVAYYGKLIDEFPMETSELEKDSDLALAMVSGYFDWIAETGQDADMELVEAEREVAIALPSVPSVTLVGKLDLRFRRRSDGARRFLDHKTVGDLISLPKTAQIATQFLHYALLERLLVPATQTTTEWTDGGIYNLLKRSKRTSRATPPFYARHEVRHTDDALRAYYKKVTTVAREILALRSWLDKNEPEAVEFCYPNAMHDCSWSCPFLAICPMFDDGSDPESVVRIAFREGDPNERYTELKGVG